MCPLLRLCGGGGGGGIAFARGVVAGVRLSTFSCLGSGGAPIGVLDRTRVRSNGSYGGNGPWSMISWTCAGGGV